jgi:PAT family beta-lactamase induction signal transducer AmpG
MTPQTLAQTYFNRRMAVLLGLGFASGLPSVYRLLGSTVQVWLGDYDYSIQQISLFLLVGLPFTFNFVWAPILDRFVPRIGGGLGRRRAWLLIFQLAIMGAIIMMAVTGPTHVGQSLELFAIAAFLVAFLVASHDVVADAYRTDVLTDQELGAGAAIFVNGYRVGMAVAGAGALFASQFLSWQWVYIMLGVLMLVGMFATWYAPNPPGDVKPPATLQEAVIEPVREYFGRTKWWGVVVLGFIVLFKLPDAMANAMTIPLLQKEIGFSKDEIALARELFGLIVLLLGALAGGAAVSRWGLVRSLWIFAGLQALSNFGFCLLAISSKSMELLVIVVAVESFCQGMVTAGFIALLMSLCNRRYSATQYALFTSLNHFTGTVVGAMTGFVVADIGYARFFALTVLAGLPGIILLWLVSRYLHRPAE